METNYDNLKFQIGKNICEYRKLANLSQIEFAEKLNYSDKSVSKWERGESLPDIIVLKQIADLFGITVNDLLSQKDVKKKRIDLKKLIRNKTFVLLLSIGLVFLVASVFFVFLQMFDILPNHNYLAFVYALPISAIICMVFFTKWKWTMHLLFAQSAFVWSLALSLCLSIPYDRIWFLLIIAVPLQILIILWNWMRKKKQNI